MAVCALSLGACARYELDGTDPALTEPKAHAWKALVVGDTDFHLAIGTAPTASTASLRVPVSTKAPFVLNIGAGERLSVFAEAPGSVWVSEVR